jgi:hypothetical protein
MQRPHRTCKFDDGMKVDYNGFQCITMDYIYIHIDTIISYNNGCCIPCPNMAFSCSRPPLTRFSEIWITAAIPVNHHVENRLSWTIGCLYLGCCLHLGYLGYRLYAWNLTIFKQIKIPYKWRFTGNIYEWGGFPLPCLSSGE